MDLLPLRGHVPDLLDVLDLPVAALSAAVLDGELYRLGERYRPVDLPPDAAARAGSLAGLLGRGRVAASRTAAWVWGCGRPIRGRRARRSCRTPPPSPIRPEGCRRASAPA